MPNNNVDYFVHLHNHSSYSLLDGIIQPQDLAKQAKLLGQPAVALTDHGTIAGWIKFYRSCKELNIKPILGCEIYIDFMEEFGFKKPNHLTIIAMNNIGYKNIITLNNIATLKNGFKRLRVTFKELSEHSEGIIVMSGCPNSPFNRLIQADKDPRPLMERFVKVFGANFYIELMDHGLEIEKKTLPILREISEKYSIVSVATNDVHYLVKEDAEAQYIAMLDSMKKNIKDESKFEQLPSEFYLKKRNELSQFAKEELNTTVEIARLCTVEIERYPDSLPDLDYEIDTKLIYPVEKLPQDYRDRYEYERKILEEANLIPYFKVVTDFISYSKEQNIPIGPGRGSIGGSLFAFMHGIHKVNPMRYGLYFSRFYNHGRKGGMPDIDTDFPKEDIEKIYDYIVNKYSVNNVCHIGISSKAGVKGALKMVCRTYKIDFQLSNHYTKLVPDKSKDIYDILSNKEAKELYDKDVEFQKIIQTASKTAGINFSYGIHASGIIISKYDLTQILPMRKEDGCKLDITYWDMEDIEWLGFLKFDFLKIDTIDIIKKTLAMIGKDSYDYILKKFDDSVFKFIQDDSHVGLFQLTSQGISKLTREMKPDNIMEIANILAIYRPGPLESNVDRLYVDRKFGAKVQYDHPLLEPILKDSYGNLIYQEQVIRICIEIGGFSETDADVIRKIIGKKKKDEVEMIAKMKDKFLNGAIGNGVEPEIAEKIWGGMEAHSGYSFNLSHSLEYAYITYMTAYLKKYHTAEFLASCLSLSKNDEETAKYLNECKRLGIKVKLPNIKKSKTDFIVSNGVILYSLRSIKNTGDSALEKILQWQQQKDQTLVSLMTMVKPNKKIIESLVRSGALDVFAEKDMTMQEFRGKTLYELCNDNYIANAQYATDLFGNNTTDNLWKPLTDKEIMTDERKYLGSFITRHPLDEYSDVIENTFTQLPSSEMVEGRINIIGICDSIVTKVDRNKNEFAIVRLMQYNYVPVSLVFYNKIWEKTKPLIRENCIIAVNGKLREIGNFIVDTIIEIK